MRGAQLAVFAQTGVATVRRRLHLLSAHGDPASVKLAAVRALPPGDPSRTAYSAAAGCPSRLQTLRAELDFGSRCERLRLACEPPHWSPQLAKSLEPRSCCEVTGWS